MKFVLNCILAVFLTTFLSAVSVARADNSWALGAEDGINAYALIEQMNASPRRVLDMFTIADSATSYEIEGTVHPDILPYEWGDVEDVQYCDSYMSSSTINAGVVLGRYDSGDDVDGIARAVGVKGVQYTCTHGGDLCYSLLAAESSLYTCDTCMPHIFLAQYYDDHSCFQSPRSSLDLAALLSNKNLILIASSGDSNSASINYPANDFGVWTAVALTREGTKTANSNYGSLVDFAVPAVDFRTHWHDQNGMPGYATQNPAYLRASNTAATMLAGAAAMLSRCAYEDAGIKTNLRQRVYDALASTARKDGIPGASKSKHGRIDVLAAAIELGCVEGEEGEDPSIGILSPSSGARVEDSQVIEIASSPSENVTVTLFVDGQEISTLSGNSPLSTVWDTSELSPGLHTLTAELEGQDGYVSDSHQVVKEDDAEYSVQISSPSNGQNVAGTITVKAISNPSDVGEVRFKVDGQVKAVRSGGGPYTWNWNTDAFSKGNHTLSVALVVDDVKEDEDSIDVRIVDTEDLVEIINPPTANYSIYSLGNIPFDVLLGDSFEKVRIYESSCGGCAPNEPYLDEVGVGVDVHEVNLQIMECSQLRQNVYYIARACRDKACTDYVDSDYVSISFRDNSINFDSLGETVSGVVEVEAEITAQLLESNSAEFGYRVVDTQDRHSFSLADHLVEQWVEYEGVEKQEYRFYWDTTEIPVGTELRYWVAGESTCGTFDKAYETTVMPEVHFHGLRHGDVVLVDASRENPWRRPLELKISVDSGATIFDEVELYAIYAVAEEDREILLSSDAGTGKGTALNPYDLSFSPVHDLLVPVLEQDAISLLSQEIILEARLPISGDTEMILREQLEVRFEDFWVDIKKPLVPYEPHIINIINSDSDSLKGFDIEIEEQGAFAEAGSVKSVSFGINCLDEGDCQWTEALSYSSVSNAWIGSWIPDQCIAERSGSWDVLVSVEFEAREGESQYWHLLDVINWRNEGQDDCENSILSPGSGSVVAGDSISVHANVNLDTHDIDASKGVELLLDGQETGMFHYGSTEQVFQLASHALEQGRHKLGLQVIHPEGFPRVIDDQHIVILGEENGSALEILSPLQWETLYGTAVSVYFDVRVDNVVRSGCSILNQGAYDVLSSEIGRCTLDLAPGTYFVKTWVETASGEHWVSFPRAFSVRSYEEACFLIRDPDEGQLVSGSLDILVDTEGCGESLGSLQFSVKSGDEVRVLGSVSRAPYMITWDTTLDKNGAATLFVSQDPKDSGLPGHYRAKGALPLADPMLLKERMEKLQVGQSVLRGGEVVGIRRRSVRVNNPQRPVSRGFQGF